MSDQEIVAETMPEPSGLWAVVERISPEQPDWPQHLVKGPCEHGGPYWWEIGTENGWSWDQVLTWPGTLRLVREGIES